MKTIADHILDIVENSVRASATLIEIIIQEYKNRDLYALEIRDDGCGMTKDTARKALEPFFTTRTTRKIGLGLPLLKQNAVRSGGILELFSEPGMGTIVKATFGLTHIDRPPLGDIALVFFLLVAGHDQVSFVYDHATENGVYTISSDEIKKTLEGIPVNNALIREAIKDLINNNLEKIQASK